jgi:hypothetical protein
LDAVAATSADAVASIMRAMRDDNRHDDAQALLEAVCNSARTAQQVIDLVSALWAAALDNDASAVLDTAASRLTMAEISDLAASLRAADHEQDALRLCLEAAAQHPVPDVVTLVAALRDVGRPIDSNRLLDSTQGWSANKSAELITMLRKTGAEADVRRVVAAVARSEAHQFPRLIKLLRQSGADMDAAALLAIAGNDRGEAFCDMIRTLREGGLGSDADRALAGHAGHAPGEICDLLQLLHQKKQDEDAAHLIRLVARRGWTDASNLLPLLRDRGLNEDSGLIVQLLAENLSIQEIASHAELLTGGGEGDTEGLLAALTRRPLSEALVIIDVLQQAHKVNAKLLAPTLKDRSDEEIIKAFSKVGEDGSRGIFREAFVTIGSIRSFPSAFSLARALKAAGLNNSSRRVLGAALSGHDVNKIISLYANQQEATGPEDASILLEAAATVLPVPQAAEMVESLERLNYGFWRGPQRAKDCVLVAFAQERPSTEAYTLAEGLKRGGRYPEARTLLRYAGLPAK